MGGKKHPLNLCIFHIETLMRWIGEKKMEINLAVTNRGKVSFPTYDLYSDNKGLYFEYGHDYTKIYIDNFEIV